MSFTFVDAKRENVGVLVALAGASGSGKTYSALELATGISPAERIGFIDTEARRGLHYAGRFNFKHADMRPPFSPERVIEGVEAAEKAGCEAIIIDSMSHEYDGEGGIKWDADELEARGVKAPGNWNKPKSRHKKMMARLLQCRSHLIFCLRAEEKIKIDKDENGKTIIIDKGWTPICEKRFMFEMTASFTLTPNEPGRPNYSLPHKCQEQHRPIFPEGKHITRDAGAMLAAWARGEEIGGPLKERAMQAAHKGTKAYQAFWEGLAPTDKRLLAKEHDGLKAEAAKHDKGAGA